MYAFELIKKGACNLWIIKMHRILNVCYRTLCDIK